MKAFTKGPLTGWHFTAIIVSFFAVVITVNLIMARFATSTFGGVVVANSYVASQNYNKWLDAAERQKTLGWAATARQQADGRIALTLAGATEPGVTVAGVARHPLGRQPDMALRFVATGPEQFTSETPLAAGRWKLRISARNAAGQPWRAELDIR
ncbi:FixH family protein [Novosphingobium sp.]|uniref:FixH family protein n=1 Tax=Novosphingobium sp. TaxID=1874826 RepID=UPI0027357EF3|nr:FixH family protein [Novosphingobium sp.]MDP3908420.1 FixH family protein [Novosphingobium sp.]